MRREQALWGGLAATVFVAGFAGYVVSGWNPISHSHELSAAQIVALRFPQDSADDTVSSVLIANAAQADQAQSSLLNPQPMAPTIAPAVAAADAQIGPPLQLHMAALEQPARAQAAAASAQQTPPATVQASAARPAVATAAPATRQSLMAAAQSNGAKLAAAAHRALNERPGFVLNDSQIASIKQRLNLTPDQEEMWPAVEAALRNLAYTRSREARSRGVAANTQLAQADPNSPEVQGLKSAAIPLLMSFTSEQKDEVRNLAHVMGLDQLATQF